MITKFKIFEQYIEIDPYGEEFWNEEALIERCLNILKNMGYKTHEIRRKTSGYLYAILFGSTSLNYAIGAVDEESNTLKVFDIHKNPVLLIKYSNSDQELQKNIIEILDIIDKSSL